MHPGSVITGISHETLSSPDAQEYLPDFLARLRLQQERDDPNVGLTACANFCVALAAGKGDRLSGMYLEPTWDLEEMVKSKA